MHVKISFGKELYTSSATDLSSSRVSSSCRAGRSSRYSTSTTVPLTEWTRPLVIFSLPAGRQVLPKGHTGKNIQLFGIANAPLGPAEIFLESISNNIGVLAGLVHSDHAGSKPRKLVLKDFLVEKRTDDLTLKEIDNCFRGRLKEIFLYRSAWSSHLFNSTSDFNPLRNLGQKGLHLPIMDHHFLVPDQKLHNTGDLPRGGFVIINFKVENFIGKIGRTNQGFAKLTNDDHIRLSVLTHVSNEALVNIENQAAVQMLVSRKINIGYLPVTLHLGQSFNLGFILAGKDFVQAGEVGSLGVVVNKPYSFNKLFGFEYALPHLVHAQTGNPLINAGD